MKNNSVLIVDHDSAWTSLLAASLNKAGLAAGAASSAGEALDLARRREYGVVVMDLVLPGTSGMDALRQIKAVSPRTQFIILTSRPTQESLLEAIREHLFDYLCKPVELEALIGAIRRALAAEAVAPILSAAPPAEFDPPAALGWRHESGHCPMLVGESEAIRQVRQQIAEVTPTQMTVLLRGESGTGKGVVARMIHELSARGGKGALVKINCPAIPETLLESELFGHESGALTGTEGRKPGRFELAHGGTIFMDEIGEIPARIQVKLLHVIEHKETQRIGGSQVIRVDARILAATNALLEQMIAAGRFRADLFYRLNEYSIHLPPLRKRVEDIPLLVQHFLDLYGREFGRPDLSVGPKVMSLLLRHPWHGNVRELESVIRRFALTGKPDLIESLLRDPAADKPAAGALGRETLRQSEIQALMTALVESRWNQRRAALMLGISYSALRRRIEKYRLKFAGSVSLASPLSIAADGGRVLVGRSASPEI